MPNSIACAGNFGVCADFLYGGGTLKVFCMEGGRFNDILSEQLNDNFTLICK